MYMIFIFQVMFNNYIILPKKRNVLMKMLWGNEYTSKEKTTFVSLQRGKYMNNIAYEQWSHSQVITRMLSLLGATSLQLTI